MTGARQRETPIRDLEARVQREYRDMPGQRLTVPQVSKLWNVDETVAHAVLDGLVRRRFLRHVEPYYFRSDLAQPPREAHDTDILRSCRLRRCS